MSVSNKKNKTSLKPGAADNRKNSAVHGGEGITGKAVKPFFYVKPSDTSKNAYQNRSKEDSDIGIMSDVAINDNHGTAHFYPSNKAEASVNLADAAVSAPENSKIPETAAEISEPANDCENPIVCSNNGFSVNTSDDVNDGKTEDSSDTDEVSNEESFVKATSVFMEIDPYKDDTEKVKQPKDSAHIGKHISFDSDFRNFGKEKGSKLSLGKVFDDGESPVHKPEVKKEKVVSMSSVLPAKEKKKSANKTPDVSRIGSLFDTSVELSRPMKKSSISEILSDSADSESASKHRGGEVNKEKEDTPKLSGAVSNDSLLALLKASDIKLSEGAEKVSRRNGDFIRRFIMAVLLVVIAVSAVNIVLEIRSKSNARDYYSEMRDMFYSGDMLPDHAGYLAKDNSSVPENRLYSDDGVLQKVNADEDLHSKYEIMLPNLEALKHINSNVFAWIKIDGTNVDYPVVRSPRGNNNYYLFRDLNNQINESGSIFCDYNNSMNLSDNRNTCIYGHNMNDQSMFQTIMNLKSRQVMLETQIEIYTSAGIYVYTPIAAYEAMPSEQFFRVAFTDDVDFENFLGYIKAKARSKLPVVPTKDDKILTLVTCTNTLIDKRFVVQGVLKEIIR
ncbi:MAG: class B sortase [Clostridia bacterium]|nr:class B sortase [Clostridia bacterium]